MHDMPSNNVAIDAVLASLPEVMNTAELARALGVSQASLACDRYRRTDCIPYIKIGHRVRYLRDDVVGYLARHRLSGETRPSDS